MKQNEDLKIALLNLVSLEKCAADNDVLLNMTQGIRETLITKIKGIDIKKIEEAVLLLSDAEKSLEQGDTGVAHAYFGAVYAKLYDKI